MELQEYRKKVANLDVREQKLRDLYLRDISLGKILGPMTGYPSLDKPWLKYYPKIGITTSIPTKKIYDFVYENNKDHLNAICLKYFGNSITYKTLFESIEKVAKSFKQLGIKEGDIVTMAMATTPEMVYIIYGLNRIGAIVNVIDPRLKANEFQEKINATKSTAFIGLEMCTDQVETIQNNTDLNLVVSVSPIESASPVIKFLSKLKKDSKKEKSKTTIDWHIFLEKGKEYRGEIDSLFRENQPIVILYTGGTTGTPKGVMLTNENFNTMALTQTISGFNQDRGDRFLTFLPPFSAYCVVNSIHDPLYMGFENTLIPQFDLKDFPKLLLTYKPNHVLSGPVLWEYLLKDKRYNKKDLSFLKSPISGGDTLNQELEIKINKHLAEKGCKYRIVQGYGMTEVSAAACYSKDEAYKLGSVGIPYVKNNISVFDPETNEEKTINEQGEICVSTPTMMAGYYNNDEETHKVIKKHPDGTTWVHTGDVGRISPDGNIYIEGRLKRLIVRSGNKIFPSLVENIITTIPTIENAVVVQMPNSKEFHVPVAYVVLEEQFRGMEDTVSQQIDTAISEKHPDFYVPYKYIFKTELPLTGMSKVDFKQLESEAQKYVNNDSRVIVDYQKESTLTKVLK